MGKRSKADFTSAQIELIYERDRHRCMACGTTQALTIQHRRAKGMGGIGDKHEPLVLSDGIVLCAHHNEEAEGGQQQTALTMGWKIPRNCPVPAELIPVFDGHAYNWSVLIGNRREWIASDFARALIKYALEQ